MTSSLQTMVHSSASRATTEARARRRLRNMKTNFQLLARNGLARRTFVVMAATIATIVLGVLWLASHWSGQYVRAQVDRETSAITKQYGLAVFQRLELAAAALHSAASLATDLTKNEQLSGYFERIEVFPSDRSMDDGRLRLRVRHKIVPIVELVLERPSGTIVGRLSPDYLWQPGTLDPGLEIRVLDAGGQQLFAHRSSTENGAAGPGDERHTKDWELFLRERFASDSWTVRITAGMSEHATALARFRWLLLASLLPLLAGMGLLASVLIRRSHRPLERLIAATRDIAAGRFDANVEEIGDADSRALIKAFNEMTGRIARQWRAMQLWSRIDQSIITTPDFEATVRVALLEAQAILKCSGIALVCFPENEEDERATLLRIDADGIATPSSLLISRDVRARLAASHSMLVGAGDVYWESLAASWEQEASRRVRVTPVQHGSAVRGALLTSHAANTEVDADSLAGQKHLAERLAVALAAYERDRALVHNANFDDLTQLANRRQMQQFLQTEVARNDAAQTSFALLFLDLDRFKLVNDAIGHSVGDALLQAVAARLKASLPSDHFIARLGGDEFTIVIPGVDDPQIIAGRVERLLAALSGPIALGEVVQVVSASIGIAIFPQHGADSEALLRNADTAMYQAKRSGVQRYAFYRAEMNAHAMERVRLEHDLRRALHRDELHIHYQPQVDIRSGEVVGAEALLRWQHPELGLLTPDRFLGIAEDTGLIVPIGDWVVGQACSQYRRWRAEGIELQSLAVNASVAQLMVPAFVAKCRAAIETYHVPRGVLEVEITETALAGDLETIERVLANLRELGIRVAIDDFGVGYSSLRYLQRLPFDVLKVDRSFIPTEFSAADGASLCEVIIGMAHNARKGVVAEGVETAEQAGFLSARGCHIAQGYFYARALPAEVFAQYCRERTAIPAAG